MTTRKIVLSSLLRLLPFQLLGADDRGFECRRGLGVLFATASGANPDTCPVDTGGSFPVGGAGHLPPAGAKVGNAWS